jgi:hypothetical protein
MQRVAPASAAILAAAFLLLHSSGAWSAEPAPATSCGTSTQEAIAAADKALSSKNHEDERAAIACLARALTSVDARLHAVETGAAAPAALIAPKGEGRNQR